MNQKELNEIRRRFKLDRNSISKIFGCYVNSNKEVISWVDASMGLMQQEEQEMKRRLRAQLDGRLSAGEIPQEIRFLETLPKNESGKVRKRDLI